MDEVTSDLGGCPPDAEVMCAGALCWACTYLTCRCYERGHTGWDNCGRRGAQRLKRSRIAQSLCHGPTFAIGTGSCDLRGCPHSFAPGITSCAHMLAQTYRHLYLKFKMWGPLWVSVTRLLICMVLTTHEQLRAAIYPCRPKLCLIKNNSRPEPYTECREGHTGEGISGDSAEQRKGRRRRARR